jgi:deoxyribonuclease-4
MPILGSHQSIAGGHHRAVQRAAALGFDCVQLFTASPRSLGLPPTERRSENATARGNTRTAALISPQQAAQFQDALRQCRIGHPLAHDGYLINLASPDASFWDASVKAFVEELRRAEALGIPYVVTHPGSYIDGTPRRGVRRVIRALDRVHTKTRGMAVGCLLETTAGQGTSLGWRFEHLAWILDGVREPDRLGVCFDTGHVFAAGYALGTPDEYEETLGRLDALVGLGRVKAFHLNDSARELGSRVDRHAHIGRGQMGLEPFRLLLRDPRFQAVPMYLETPKGQEAGVDFDAINLNTLRDLAKAAPDQPCAKPRRRATRPRPPR